MEIDGSRLKEGVVTTVIGDNTVRPMQLDDLRPLRSAPELDDAQRGIVLAELSDRLAACEWFTVGVMASSAEQAIGALRALERALQWTPLTLGGEPLPEGAVFLKGNQRNGTALVRAESGLGLGILISGHAPSNPDAEDTWGPLPLDMFA